MNKTKATLKRTHDCGFTLIELLLVIAVISVLAAVGIMSFRRSFQENRIDKVAIGMQHVLEAAMAYYVDQNEWPANHACDGTGGDTTDFVTNYLPNSNTKSFYGTDYCWEKAGDTNRLFWVAVKIPGDGVENLAVAKRLAARLPNAIATNDPDTTTIPAPACDASDCFVRAEITVPGTASNNIQQSSIAATGECHGTSTPNAANTGTCTDSSSGGQQQYSITFPACASGTEPSLNVSPNYIELPHTQTGYTLQGMQAMPGTCTTTADPSGLESCSVAVAVTVCKPNGPNNCSEVNIKGLGGQAGASYIVSCVKHSTRRLYG